MLCINLSLFLASFVEPVVEGGFLFFALYMMVWGMTYQVVLDERILKEDKDNNE